MPDTSTPSANAAPVYCRTELFYASDMEPVPVPTDIHDGRQSPLPGWESCGFELMQFPSAVADWTDQSALQNLHLDETESFLKAQTGCAVVLFYPPLVRSREEAQRQADLAPIQFVHSDYTHGYRAMIEDPEHPYHEILKPSMQRAGVEVADIQRATRVLTLQCWRNIGAPDMDYPLCFCDARTVPETDLAPIRVSEYGGLKTEFDSFVSRPPESGTHDWYFYPEMAADEVVLFRAFDSDRAEADEPFWTLHTSFRDPTRPADAPGRESIETRGICLFY